MVKVVLFIVISLAYDCGVGLAAFPYAGEVLKKPFRSKGPSAGCFQGFQCLDLV